MSEVKQSINKVQIIGTVAELNLEVVTKEIELTGANDVKKKVTCKQIVKKDFKNPSVLIECSPKDDDGNVRYTANIGVNFFNTAEKKLDEHGNIIDNPRFKSMETYMNYIPKSKNKDNATRVKIDGSLNENGYASTKDNKNYDFVSFPTINAFQMTSTNVPEDDSCDGKISGIIRTIKPEVVTKGEEQEETGRLVVDFYTFDRNGATYPVQLVVDKDLADDFTSAYEQGTSCELFYEVFERQVGEQKKSGKAAFGRREEKITSGYSVTEFSVFKGEEPFEEENEYFIASADMKVAMEERQNMIDTRIEEKKKADKEDKGKDSGKSKGLKGRGEKIDTTDEPDDLPF